MNIERKPQTQPKNKQGTKEEIGFWANIVFACTSVIFAIMTGYALIQQNDIQKEVLKIQRQTQQPLFKIQYMLEDSDNDDYYDTNTITIYNEGYSVKHIQNIMIQTFYVVEIFHNNTIKQFQFEINGFYNTRMHTNNLVGELLVCYTTDNEAYYSSLYDEAIKETRLREGSYHINKFNLIKIEYEDAIGDNNVEYYQNDMPIIELNYTKINNDTYNKNKMFVVNKFTFADLLKYIEENEQGM